MRFRRRSAATAEGDPGDEGSAASAPALEEGPWDVDDVEGDGVDRVDLGSLLLQGEPDRDLRLQVDETSGAVQAVLLAGQHGALDVRAFAASRHGDLWSEVRPRIAADMARRGGTATEQEGRFGPELACEVRVQGTDGQVAVQQSRVVGINGPRWMLRATFIGRPAVDPETGREWEDVLARLVVRRGQHAIPPGEPLPITMPDNARRVPQPGPDPRTPTSSASPRPAEEPAEEGPPT